jgi:hypothetical protein
MMATLPIQTNELCPLTTRLLPKELSHAFGIADEGTFDSRPAPSADQKTSAAAVAVSRQAEPAPAQPGSNAGAQHKRKAAEQQQQQQQAAASEPQQAASNVQQPSVPQPQPMGASAAQTAPLQASSSMLQVPSSSAQQTTSSVSAGLQHAVVAAVAGRQIHGFPAAYVSPHSLLYGQQAVAALPHLAGMPC